MQKEEKQPERASDKQRLIINNLTIHKELYRAIACFNALFFFISLQNIYEKDCYYDKGE